MPHYEIEFAGGAKAGVRAKDPDGAEEKANELAAAAMLKAKHFQGALTVKEFDGIGWKVVPTGKQGE